MEVRTASSSHLHSHSAMGLRHQSSWGLKGLATASAVSVQVQHLLFCHPAAPAGAHLAALMHPRGGTAGYHMHPVVGDCCIHLAAVPPAAHPLQVTRYGLHNNLQLAQGCKPVIMLLTSE